MSPTNDSKPIRERSVNELWSNLKDFFEDLIDLREGMDQEGTIANIHNNKKMRGANAWLLMCSIMVASLGLDLNSPAVIIGAMLISPLMSPILGIGLGIGINDKATLIVSLRHFGLAITIALITSVLYFKLTPFGTITDEIMARTSPTLLDGMVAIFGGLAGVISITRLDKSNAIPGVAIATALMPPLCVAGFGLANGEWSFFLNAFYLFFLNSFFIAITTYIIIRVLGFPNKVFLNRRELNRNRIYIAVFSLIILIPAISILYNTVSKVKEKNTVDFYLKEKISDEGTIISEWTFVDDNTTAQRDSIHLILKIIGEPLSQQDILQCDSELEEILNKPVSIITYQSEEIPIDDIDKLQKQFLGFKGEFQDKFNELQSQKSEHIHFLTNKIDSLESRNLTQLYKEVHSMFPAVEEIGFTEKMKSSNASATKDICVALVKWKANMSVSQREDDFDKLKKFLIVRSQKDSLELISY